MDRWLRLGVAAINVDDAQLALRLWSHAPPPADPIVVALADALDGGDPATADLQPVAEEHDRVTIDLDGPVLSIDGAAPEAADLSPEDLAAAARVVGRWRGDLDAMAIDRVVAAIGRSSPTHADRLRLLLQDYVYRGAVRSVAADRLESFAASEGRKDADVESLFDAG